MTTSEKNELLDQLSACHNRVNYFSLLAGDKAQGSAMFRHTEEQNRRLNEEIDMLLRGLYADWNGNAAHLKGEFAHINEELAKNLSEIEHDANVAQNAAQASDHIDEVIGLAASLITADDNLECYLGVYGSGYP